MIELAVAFVVDQAAWWAAGTSIVTQWMYGSKKWWAPWWGVTIGQAPWMILAVTTQQPGLLVTALVYGGIHIRNGILWWRTR